MVKHLLPLVPGPLKFYVEPFAGGASLFFALPAKPAYSVLNDTRDDLINYYRIVQTRAAELEMLLRATLHSESEWNRAKSLSDDRHADPLQRAWATHTKIMQSFANKGTGWARHNSAHRFSGHFRADAASRLAEYVEISCEDAIACIHRRDHEHAFFYVDPPYPGADRPSAWDRWDQTDWERLIETLDGIAGSYLLSGYPNVVTPRDCEFFSVTRSSTASRGAAKPVTECLWRRLNRHHEALL